MLVLYGEFRYLVLVLVLVLVLALALVLLPCVSCVQEEI